MSCFIMNSESVAKIATYAYSFFAPGAEYNDPDEWETAIYQAATEDGAEFSEKSIYSALMRMNISAYNQRYRDTESGGELADFPRNTPNAIVLEMNLPALVKLIECYIYQCSEGNVCESPLYKAVEMIEHITYLRIVHEIPAYQAAPWG